MATHVSPAHPALLRPLIAVLLALGLAVTAAPAQAAPPAVPAAAAAATSTAAPPAISTAAVNSCAVPDFADAPPGSPFYASITWMACQALTVGYPDGTFGVQRSISRGEMAAFLYRLVDPIYTPPATSPFRDVPTSSSFYPAVAWLSSAGIVRGFADGTFRPGQSITRGQQAQILFGAARSGYVASGPSGFSDVGTSHSFYRAISWMRAAGYASGYADGTFRPSRPTTRGESAALLHRASGDVLAGWSGRRAPEPASFALTGSGWGHGVGMSQYGAATLARQGRSASWILGNYYYPATPVYTASRVGQSVRVHLADPTSVALSGSARVRVPGLATTTGSVTLAASNGQVRVTMPGRAPVLMSRAIVEWEGTRYWPGTASTLRVPAANGTQTLTLRHGRVEVTVRGGRLNIVTVLRLTDEYLYGLAEMPASWPAAALQAQVAAGRTYALRNSTTVKPECDCHIWDEVRSQKFSGWAQESAPAWRAAVNATVRRNASGVPTSALVVTYGGAPIEALYHSSSGGYTRNNETVFAAPAVVYLRGRADPSSVSALANNPNRSWSATVSQAQVARAFLLPEITRITVARDGNGVPQRMTAHTAEGPTKTLTATQFRNLLGLKSGWVTVIIAR